jgi:multicomponent Na+:H+ antiporter subunit G
MKEELVAALGILLVVVGTSFSVISVVGYLRLPDVYTRLHATGKVSVFGIVLFLIAAVAIGAVDAGRAVVLGLFLVLAGPVLSHSIGSAAYRIGIPMRGAVRDDLAARGSTGREETTAGEQAEER